ncbi:hypothetical protein COCNU_13G005920 [Cocos nucifera]|uniref:Uncharacterized protein n=1 Tax=Cocos nucifera TaxID=13894 RepID=A0A8K0IT88_COCNU|nr:hypothetical protein COCNU_13G005920 [Cocos nucifera]
MELLNVQNSDAEEIPPIINKLHSRIYIFQIKVMVYNVIQGFDNYTIIKTFIPDAKLEEEFTKNKQLQATSIDKVGSTSASIALPPIHSKIVTTHKTGEISRSTTLSTSNIQEPKKKRNSGDTNDHLEIKCKLIKKNIAMQFEDIIDPQQNNDGVDKHEKDDSKEEIDLEKITDEINQPSTTFKQSRKNAIVCSDED